MSVVNLCKLIVGYMKNTVGTFFVSPLKNLD